MHRIALKSLCEQIFDDNIPDLNPNVKALPSNSSAHSSPLDLDLRVKDTAGIVWRICIHTKTHQLVQSSSDSSLASTSLSRSILCPHARLTMQSTSYISAMRHAKPHPYLGSMLPLAAYAATKLFVGPLVIVVERRSGQYNLSLIYGESALEKLGVPPEMHSNSDSDTLARQELASSPDEGDMRSFVISFYDIPSDQLHADTTFSQVGWLYFIVLFPLVDDESEISRSRQDQVVARPRMLGFGKTPIVARRMNYSGAEFMSTMWESDMTDAMRKIINSRTGGVEVPSVWEVLFRRT